jgi:protein-tyrosine phosphatase
LRKVTGYPLWIGHAGDVRDPTKLLEAGISAVVCVVESEPPPALPRELVYCRFPLVDGTGNPEWLLRAAVQTVACLLRSSTPTLVHCSAGISRSPAVAGAALAITRGCSFAEGLIAVTESGPSDVSPGLWAEIQEALNVSPTAPPRSPASESGQIPRGRGSE